MNGSRAQSETVGYILVVALVLAGAGVTVLIGGAGITDTQNNNEFQRAENSMTLFDSRAAMVALGDAGSQTVSLGEGGGMVYVEEDAGWLRVTHTNYTEDTNTTHAETIYNETLGQVVYESDSGTIAYQGGGVWKIHGGGDARMVSPPEFHYRGATLTLPAIQVNGSGAASGSVDMRVTPKRQAKLVYPNETSSTSNGTGSPYNATANTTFRNYANPVRNGTVSVTVKSDYADGWESYFRQRTTGFVTRSGENVVTLTLNTTKGDPGSFDMPTLGENDYEPADGIKDNHSITEFTTTLAFDGGGTNEFSYYEEDHGKQWELHVTPDKSGNLKCGDDPDVNIYQYYYDGNAAEEYEMWEVTLSNSSSAIDWGCNSAGNATLKVNFTNNGSDTKMVYDKSFNIGGVGNAGDVCDGGNQWCFAEDIKDNNLKSTVTLDGHGSIGSCEIGTYNASDSTDCTLGHIVEHYMAEMGPDMDIHAKNGPGQSGPVEGEPHSYGALYYPTDPDKSTVTYLHITKNEIQVSVDS